MARLGIALTFSLCVASTVALEDPINTTTTEPCPDPLAAILVTLDCVEREDVACAASGYDSSAFRKLHNGIDTNTTITAEFWAGSFAFVDIGLDYNYQANVGVNQASLRYVEVVNTTDGSELGFKPCDEYPWGASFVQHEHAIVTVDDSCRMILWDQYGDNEEQVGIESAVDLILSNPAVLCRIGLIPADSDVCLEAPKEIDCQPLPVSVPVECPPEDSGAYALTSWTGAVIWWVVTSGWLLLW